ncbi:MAG: hypothetical protein ABIJ34_01235 [archaeon]
MQQWKLSKYRQYYVFTDGSHKIEIADMASCDYTDYPFLKAEKFARIILDGTGYDIPKHAVPIQIDELENLILTGNSELPEGWGGLSYFLENTKNIFSRENYYAGNCAYPIWKYSQLPWQVVAREYSRLSITSIFLSKSELFNELNILRSTASGMERYGVAVNRGDFTSSRDIYAIPKDQVPLREFWKSMTNKDLFISCGMDAPTFTIEKGPVQAQLDDLMLIPAPRLKGFQIYNNYGEFMKHLDYG